MGLGFPGGQGGHRVNGNPDPLRNGVQGTGRFGSGARNVASNDSGGGGGGADLFSGDGGGGGGGGSDAMVGSDGTIDPAHPHQDYGRGATVIYGSSNFSTALLGGGGGGGAADDDLSAYGGSGGNGGGISRVAAANVTGSGAFDVSGAAGGAGVGGGQGAGGGGGGAGGALGVIARSFSGPTLMAAGGAGGAPSLQSGHGGAGGPGYVSQSFDSSRSGQTISFPPIPNHTYGDPDFTVSATASSGLPVTIVVLAGPCTISGTTVHLTGAGTCKLRATQSGNADYSPAAPVTRSFAISKAPTTTGLTLNPDTVNQGGSTTLTATVSSPVFVPTGSVEFFINGQSVGSVPLDGNGMASKTVTINLAPGTYPVQAVYTNSDGNFKNSKSPLKKLKVY